MTLCGLNCSRSSHSSARASKSRPPGLSLIQSLIRGQVQVAAGHRPGSSGAPAKQQLGVDQVAAPRVPTRQRGAGRPVGRPWLALTLTLTPPLPLTLTLTLTLTLAVTMSSLTNPNRLILTLTLTLPLAPPAPAPDPGPNPNPDSGPDFRSNLDPNP